MFLRIAGYQMDVRVILKVMIATIATIIFMQRVAYIHADTCEFEGHGLRIFISGTDKSWLFIWSAKGIEKQIIAYFTVDSDERNNVYTGSGAKRSAGLPQDLFGPDARLDAPFASSHDGKMLIASIYPNSIALIPSRKFVILNLKSKKVLHVVEAEYSVLSLAWSPTDKYFAVLLSQDATGQKWKGPLDWISKFLGHPISYNTLYLSIYNLDGQCVCKKVLIEKLAHGRGYIDWQ